MTGVFITYKVLTILQVVWFLAFVQYSPDEKHMKTSENLQWVWGLLSSPPLNNMKLEIIKEHEKGLSQCDRQNWVEWYPSHKHWFLCVYILSQIRAFKSYGQGWKPSCPDEWKMSIDLKFKRTHISAVECFAKCGPNTLKDNTSVDNPEVHGSSIGIIKPNKDTCGPDNLLYFESLCWNYESWLHHQIYGSQSSPNTYKKAVQKIVEKSFLIITLQKALLQIEPCFVKNLT